MKTKLFLLSAALTLGLLTTLHAQTASADSIHIRVMKNENGVQKNIDTTVASAQHDQLMQWLSAQGIELPPPPPPPPLEGDSMHKMVMRFEMNDSIPGKDGMKHLPPPPPPGAPMPPPPPGAVRMSMPPAPPLAPGTEMMVVFYDSLQQKKQCERVVITGISAEKSAPGKEVSVTREVNVYPNPSTGKITIDVNIAGKGKTELTITDMNGKTVYTEQLPESSGKISKEIDLSKNGKGMYSIRVSKAGKVIVEKIVIE